MLIFFKRITAFRRRRTRENDEKYIVHIYGNVTKKFFV
jgi:hypothetical protein